MKKLILFFSIFLSVNIAFAQNTILSKVLTWKKINFPSPTEDRAAVETFSFDGADFTFTTKELPWFGTTFPVSSNGDLSVQIINTRYEPLELSKDIDTRFLNEKLTIQSSVAKNRNAYNGKVRFIPIIKTNTGLQKLVGFDIQATCHGGKTTRPEPNSPSRR